MSALFRGSTPLIFATLRMVSALYLGLFCGCSEAGMMGDPIRTGDVISGHDDGSEGDGTQPGDAPAGDPGFGGDPGSPGDSGSGGDPLNPGQCNNNPGQLFPPGAPWNTPIDQAPLDSESDAIIGYLHANHTASARFEIVNSFNFLYADATTAHRSFSPTEDFYTPDCDPASPPVPAGGRLEEENDYYCSSDGDCHLTVIDWPECRLYEMWRANITDGTYNGGTFYGGCQAIWDLSQVPPASGRGEYCTSADAAGLPILPLVFTPDEIATGSIDHALRFILPNNHIRDDVYVHPGTHSTGATSGPSSAPPYAARLRLKASTNISGLSSAAKVVAEALKKYGMFLADGGNITFTASTDELTAHTWSEVGLGVGDLKSLSWTDFEVVELGTRYQWSSGDCTRTPITN